MLRSPARNGRGVSRYGTLTKKIGQILPPKKCEQSKLLSSPPISRAMITSSPRLGVPLVVHQTGLRRPHHKDPLRLLTHPLGDGTSTLLFFHPNRQPWAMVSAKNRSRVYLCELNRPWSAPFRLSFDFSLVNSYCVDIVLMGDSF